MMRPTSPRSCRTCSKAGTPRAASQPTTCSGGCLRRPTHTAFLSTKSTAPCTLTFYQAALINIFRNRAFGHCMYTGLLPGWATTRCMNHRLSNMREVYKCDAGIIGRALAYV